MLMVLFMQQLPKSRVNIEAEISIGESEEVLKMGKQSVSWLCQR